MNCLERFNNRMKRCGGSLRNENIKNSRMLLDKTFEDSGSYCLGVFLWELGLINYEDYESRDTIVIRLYDYKSSNANGHTIKFQTLIDCPIVVGDIIYCSKSNEYYLCTESFNMDDIHWQGKLTLCNWILKWQNNKGDILQYPCVDINSTQYNSGEMANKQFTVGSSQHMIKLPCDENTVILKTPQRFILDKDYKNPTVFIVTQNDTTTYNYGKKGLVQVTLYENPLDWGRDRVDLGICDYKEKFEFKFDNDINDNSTLKSVIKYKTTVIKSGGSAQTFTAEFYNDNKEIVNVSPKWNIICNFVDKLNIQQIDNKIMISIDDDDFIDEDFKLILSDESNNYISSLIVTIKSLL